MNFEELYEDSVAGGGTQCAATGAGGLTDMAPENMRSLTDQSGLLQERIAERKRLQTQSVQERFEDPLTSRIRERKEKNEKKLFRNNVRRVTIADDKNATDYEKARTKRIKQQWKDQDAAEEARQNGQQFKNAKLRGGDFVDETVDSFLSEWLEDNQ
jgi:hypothetical protein